MSQAKRIDDLSGNELLTTGEVASFLGVSVRTVESWRQQGKPPKYVRFSHKLLRYRAEDIKNFINQQGE